MEGKEILLSYYSATLRQYDLNFLQPGQWLNDQIITFWNEYLVHSLLEPSYPRIRLLDPAATSTFLFAPNDPEVLKSMFGALKLEEAD